MEISAGKSVLNGIAIGKIKLYKKKSDEIIRKERNDYQQEFSRFKLAKQTAMDQLKALVDKAAEEFGDENAAIFEVHMMLLDDDDFNESVEEIIRSERVNAEYAISVTCDKICEMFSVMTDEYFRARTVDIKDISERLINILSNNVNMEFVLDEPSIILAEELTPSDTLQIDKNKILGIINRLGSVNSHTAIIARALGIPALLGVDIKDEWDGQLGIIDGSDSMLYINPDREILSAFKEKHKEELSRKELLLKLKGKETVTPSGKRINLFANIGSLTELETAIDNDAEGIGLFRSEFLYMESKNFPSEEEQFKAYRKAAEAMKGKKVIIRTLDLGADKQLDYFDLGKEDNPALGYRAIRICLTQPDIFKTQLRAIYRASVYGNISVMFPMITSLEELYKIKEVISEVKKELRDEGYLYHDVELGIMVETPAAAVISDLLAEEVDFLSIGTNDLTQYTLAVDRQNSKLDDFCNTHHIAILRLIKTVIDNGHKKGCWVGICGELAADLSLTEKFIEMEIDELSVSPLCILSVRERICMADTSII
ncbi:phosphoenolpyruvate--protein phosphotransferase [Petroclostridium sp. X23]|uniref:phosphoenolpyruvate--protein phosphotransferase n=1 Tax=Petroclostridium sp. X23 TaxID=3045146 RepID=UPI0024ACE0E3|nr:phosphoenolpyruvate--protein phosphotransferase [Petroclostridium sp. X23]WHH57150.1 phosphoenolpyruvate--protein phosphotransferase [Petroclostridium sp. X23]